MRRHFISNTSFAVFILHSAAVSSALAGGTLFVDASSGGVPDGTTWCTAFTDLQSAIASAESGAVARIRTHCWKIVYGRGTPPQMVADTLTSERTRRRRFAIVSSAITMRPGPQITAPVADFGSIPVPRASLERHLSATPLRGAAGHLCGRIFCTAVAPGTDVSQHLKTASYETMKLDSVAA